MTGAGRCRPAVRCTLVRGNHDTHAGDPPPELDDWVVDRNPLRAGPFALCHMPGASPDGYVAGHLHPAVVLRGSGADALRLPCFVLGGTAPSCRPSAPSRATPRFGARRGTASMRWATGGSGVRR